MMLLRKILIGAAIYSVAAFVINKAIVAKGGSKTLPNPLIGAANRLRLMVS